MEQRDLWESAKPDGLQQGRERAEHGIRKVSRHYGDWVAKAQAAAIQHAQMYGEVTSDDLYDICPLPDGAHPNLMGSVWRGITLKAIGYTPSRRPEAHGRIIRVYTTQE